VPDLQPLVLSPTALIGRGVFLRHYGEGYSTHLDGSRDDHEAVSWRKACFWPTRRPVRANLLSPGTDPALTSALKMEARVFRVRNIGDQIGGVGVESWTS
jgi:hypothetical protein